MIGNNFGNEGFNIMPIMISPADGTSVDTLIPTVTWEIIDSLRSGTLIYYFISSDPDFGYVDYLGWQWANRGFTIPDKNLQPNYTYYWYAAYDYLSNDNTWEQGPRTPVRSFQTGSGETILPATALISPANGTNGITELPVNFTWLPVPGATEYQVQLWYECGNSSWCNYQKYTVDSHLEFPDYYLTSNSNYEWVVIPRNDYAWSETSDRWSFSTGTITTTSSGGITQKDAN
jgi:hypothetical protein